MIVIPVLATLTYRVDFFTWVRVVGHLSLVLPSSCMRTNAALSVFWWHSGYVQSTSAIPKPWATLACVRSRPRHSLRPSSNRLGSSLTSKTMTCITGTGGARVSSEIFVPWLCKSRLVLTDSRIKCSRMRSYGKQTKLWDTLFGTTRPRIECVPENIAWS